jgi:hypothetical protein
VKTQGPAFLDVSIDPFAFVFPMVGPGQGYPEALDDGGSISTGEKELKSAALVWLRQEHGILDRSAVDVLRSHVGISRGQLIVRQDPLRREQGGRLEGKAKAG